MGRRSVLVPLMAMVGVAACQGRSAPPPPPLPVVVASPPTIPDTQPAVNAPYFLGQNAFPSPLAPPTTFDPALVTERSDGGNSGVFAGPAPLGRATVTGSVAISLQPPLLWGRGLVAGCHTQISPGVVKNCLAQVDTATLKIMTTWLPPGQDLNVATAELDNDERVVVTTVQNHLLVVASPDSDNPTFRVIRDIDLTADVGPGQVVRQATTDGSGNLWFVSGGEPPTGPPATDAVVGYVTPTNQVVTTVLADQQVETGFAVDQDSVYLATAPAGSTAQAAAIGYVYDLTAATNEVETLWHESYDAGSAVKPGGVNRGTASAPLLLGGQFLAITDNADDQAHLLVFYRGALLSGVGGHGATTTTSGVSTTTVAAQSAAGGKATATTITTAPTTTVPSGTPPVITDPRLVCEVGLFTPGDSAVTSAPIAYSSTSGPTASGFAGTDSVIVANGPANSIGQVATGLTRVDIAADGSGCQTAWTTPLALASSPVLSSTTGLLYGYTQDPARAAMGTYVWYFVAVSFQNGSVVWQQRAGAGATKNNNREPLTLGANGVLYQSVPLGLVWMRDVNERP